MGLQSLLVTLNVKLELEIPVCGWSEIQKRRLHSIKIETTQLAKSCHLYILWLVKTYIACHFIVLAVVNKAV